MNVSADNAMKQQLTSGNMALKSKDIISGGELSQEEVKSIISLARVLAEDDSPWRHHMDGRTLVMLFEKPSLRTRVSFEIGISRLGGHAVFLDQQAVRIGERESVAEMALNLERWTDFIVARVFSNKTIHELAAACDIPVINALCDWFHPCQALADGLTLKQHFPERSWNDLRLAYIGDGNNVCHSLLLVSAALGIHVTTITPTGYTPDQSVLEKAAGIAAANGGSVQASTSLSAVQGHHAVYTDTWASMGDEDEKDQRFRDFAGYQVTPEVMQQAGPDARFMHCLPAYRGREVDASVIDSPQSVIYDQAENRMHAQNALLLHQLGHCRSPRSS